MEGAEFNLVREMVFLEQLVFKSKTAPGQDCPRTAFKLKTEWTVLVLDDFPHFLIGPPELVLSDIQGCYQEFGRVIVHP